MHKAISVEKIENRIFQIRGKMVMLDKDLAKLYGVETKVLIQAVKRNIRRFPFDFMFQLTEKEAASLRSQFVTSKRGGRRYLPYVFTQEGGRHAFKHIKQRTGNLSKHPNYAGVHSVETDVIDQCGPQAQD